METTTEILDCGHEPSEHSEHTTGYGTDKDGKRHCYACCATRDRDAMRRDGRATLYLTGSTLSNWPGSLSFTVRSTRVGRHNIARTRTDVWFAFEGYWWHGTQYGDNTQLCHCKRTRESC